MTNDPAGDTSSNNGICVGAIHVIAPAVARRSRRLSEWARLPPQRLQRTPALAYVD